MKARPWLFLAPALLIMSISAFLPLLTVINYSVHNIFSGSESRFVGFENYSEVMNDLEFRNALKLQLIFSCLVLLIEIPLGLLIALAVPRQGWKSSLCLVLLGIPLLIPYVVVAIVWKLFTQTDIGPFSAMMHYIGYDYNVALNSRDAFSTIILVDVWHWTPLVVLLMYAGLQSIPPAYYRAAEIDGASRFQVFRFITLPKLRPVLILAVLLRFMDSLQIYSEPLLLTGGGPGNATTYLSLFVARKGDSFELGYAGASSIIYLYIVIVLSYIFYQYSMRTTGESRS